MNIFSHISDLMRDVESPVFFELGARQGEDTSHILMLLKNPRYYLVEPDPRNLQVLFHGPLVSDVVIVDKAISDTEGTTTFYQSSGNINPNGESWTGSSSIF